MERDPDGRASAAATAVVAKGRERQDELALAGLEDIVRTLHGAGFVLDVAALLVNRAGWISDLLDYSITFADHPPVAEGLAVRDALRFAFTRMRVDVAEIDEKSLNYIAAEKLARASSRIDARLKMLGANAGRPWRKEQKLACLAAWMTLAARPT